MNDVVIRAEGLGKKYNLGVRKKSFRESMVDLASAPVQRARKLLSRQSAGDDGDDSIMWALRDASFGSGRGKSSGRSAGTAPGRAPC